MFSPELKKGSLELLILSALDGQPRHGYEIGKHLELRSGGKLEFRVSTLYSVLYRMEARGWVRGRWVERKGERRRCYYELTPEGERVLAAQRRAWRAFAAMMEDLLEASPA
jgi:DNA-binding PadR family transcriptional regulator